MDTTSHKLVKRKLTAKDLFNCSDLSSFIASIVQILSFKGASMSRFYICEYEGVRFLTKLCFYKKTPSEIYGTASKSAMTPVSHADAEINILRIFKDKIIDEGYTPCILELVYAKICEGLGSITPHEKTCKRLILGPELLPEDEIEHLMCRYLGFVRGGLAHDKCAFLVLDKCDMSLDVFLSRSIGSPMSYAILKSILFLIIYTMYVIGRIYPRFRHYDLHTENVLLKFDTTYVFKADEPKYQVCMIRGQRYAVPYFGITPKIIDFERSSLPEEGIVSNSVEDRMHMYGRADNDLLLLFYWIHHTLLISGADKLGRVDKMLKKLDPTGSYVQYYTEYIRQIEGKIPTYEMMVTNPVFDEYKKISLTRSQIHGEFTSVD